MLRIALVVFTVAFAGCAADSGPAVLPFVTELTVSDIDLRMEAVRRIYSTPRGHPGCNSNCRPYDGHIDVVLKVSEPFGPVIHTDIDGTALEFFGRPCGVDANPRSDLTELPFYCPFDTERTIKPEAGIRWLPRLPRLNERLGTELYFPGTFDPATFPTIEE